MGKADIFDFSVLPINARAAASSVTLAPTMVTPRIYRPFCYGGHGFHRPLRYAHPPIGMNGAFQLCPPCSVFLFIKPTEATGKE